MTRDGKRRVLSYEERVLWTTVTKAIAPLRDAEPDASLEPATDADVAPARKAPPVFSKPAKVQKPAASPAPPPKHPANAATAAQPLTRRMKRSVARGSEGIDARLDLHGLTQMQAHDTLLRFLRTASARDARLVLVITGKGKRSDGDENRERGVLRRQVPQWLGQSDFRDLVIGFEDAHIAHGGEGALYVRVRRNRQN